MLLQDAPLTFREYIMHEEVPLADVFREVLAFLGGRNDAALFGAQAVNAYCEPSRMTADVDVLSPDARNLAGSLRDRLAARFQFAVRVREVAGGRGFRVYQLRKPRNRHLVDVQQVDTLPDVQRFEGVPVVAPADLAALKVQSIAARKGREKELSDRLDLHRLLRAFPDLRTDEGAVAQRLRAAGAEDAVLTLWRTLASEHYQPDNDEEY
jgi:hypothetical protein